MWLHHMNGFSHSKMWKNWQEDVHLVMENDWSGSFVLLYGWNKENVRWDFFSIQIHWEVITNFEFCDEPRKLRLLISSQWIWIEKNPTVHFPYFIHRVRQNCQTNHFLFLDECFLVSFFKEFEKPLMWWSHMTSVNEFHKRLPRRMFGQNFTWLQGVEGV